MTMLATARPLNDKPGELVRPDDIREEDSLCYDMRPGDKLWNVMLTPHWDEAGNEPAMSSIFPMVGCAAAVNSRKRGRAISR
ncbi:MAG: hypothetical protein ACOH2L_17780 [Devosia sp.]